MWSKTSASWPSSPGVVAGPGGWVKSPLPSLFAASVQGAHLPHDEMFAGRQAAAAPPRPDREGLAQHV